MSQYLQFRSWVRSSSAAEKKLAATATALAVGLTVWALVPTNHPGQSVATGATGSGQSGSLSSGTGSGGGASSGGGLNATGTQTSTPAASATGASGTGTGSTGSGSAGSTSGSGQTAGATSPTGSNTGGTGGTGGSGGRTGGVATNGGRSCGNLSNTDTGVSATQIKVADILLNLAGAIGNSAVGQASPQVQQQMSQAVVDDINAHGGVDCRKLVAQYYQANPIDPSSTQNVCLQIQQAGVFAVIGGFAFPQGANDCLAQAHIPVVADEAPTPNEERQYYPYLMAISPDQVTDYKTAIFGLKSRGFFTAGQGFKKIAILEDDCSQELNRAVYNFLIQAGLTSGQIVKNEFSCPSGGFASPSDMSNFATQDSLNHVTDVAVVTGGGSFKEFTAAAKSQGYKPKYLVSDYQGFLVTATGGTGPDPQNFDGTIATTLSKFGEDTTRGLTDGASQACIAIFAKHGLPSSDVMGPYLGGTNCNLFELFAAAVDHDGSVTRTGLAPALAGVGRFNEAFPSADSIYRAGGLTTPVKVTGGDFWWTIQFQASCTCWKVIDPTEHPAF